MCLFLCLSGKPGQEFQPHLGSQQTEPKPVLGQVENYSAMGSNKAETQSRSLGSLDQHRQPKGGQ